MQTIAAEDRQGRGGKLLKINKEKTCFKHPLGIFLNYYVQSGWLAADGLALANPWALPGLPNHHHVRWTKVHEKQVRTYPELNVAVFQKEER